MSTETAPESAADKQSGLPLLATKVTDEGAKKLQQALPNCEIER